MDLKDKLHEARGYIETAIEMHAPKHVFCLLSGGHDSMSVTHFAAGVLGKRLEAVVHVNTGIGIEQTRQYVRDQCAGYGWNLLEYKATENTKADGTPDPQVYEDLVTAHGFPGAFHHRKMYNRLKQRQIERLARDFGATTAEPIMLISGCRKEESTRRMGTTKPIDPQGRLVWVAAFAEMTGLDCSDYMQREGITRNQVKDLIHMSGECLCGAFAKPGELKELALWFPEDAANIRRIEAKVRAAGFPWGWEEQPPEWWSARKLAAKFGQADAFEQEAADEIQYLCVGCNKRAEAETV
jgi:3'-phosphoadenosine 5'-phosphosulfate sulfotransferase (PAPS reductase)/FAD synthetase